MSTPASSVVRDDLGIPYLRADSLTALMRLQGRVTAADRAWQIEHQRWRMEGRTAEYLGDQGLAWDRFARQVRLEATARACYEVLDAQTRVVVDAYVEGVNEALPAALAQSQEIHLLGLESYAAEPRPWEPWTPLGIFWAIHLLFGTFPSKLFAAHVRASLGPEWLDLFRTEGGPWQAGSNAWVVGGHRTASGRPLVAGDPHRTIELPGTYHQVGLACPGVDVVGFGFPGVPGVQHFAHAGRVAWAITNAMADYQDLTQEQLRPCADGLEARGPDGWEPTDRAVETIAVRGAPDVQVPVVVTRRGPVVTGLDLGADLGPDLGGAGREAGAVAGPAAYSLRTPSQVGLDLGFDALVPLLRARSVDDVVAALARWVEPVNSVVVADDTGAMRHLVVGRVARRHEANTVGPVPAWDARHRWDGWSAGPVSVIEDVMVSANDRASGGGLGEQYATPFRAERIRELIGDRRDLTVDDCAGIQLDTLNGQAALMRELVGSVDATGAAAVVRAALLGWDGHSDLDSPGAALFAQWRHELVTWFADHPRLAPLRASTGHSPLFDPWLTVPLAIGATWGAMAGSCGRVGIDVREGVVAALDRVAAQQDPGVWGDRHTFDPIQVLDGWPGSPLVGGAPTPGDSGCVLAAGSAPGMTDRCSKGPVARYVWDLADRDESRWVVPGGSSGLPTSPHFADQLEDWLAGRLRRVGQRRR